MCLNTPETFQAIAITLTTVFATYSRISKISFPKTPNKEGVRCQANAIYKPAPTSFI